MQGRLQFLFILTSLIADATLAQSQAKIKASDGGVFGESVSISGDYALVGAPSANASGRETGAAYIFQLVDTTWVERVKLSPNDLNEFSKFGSSLSINGEFAIIGIGSKQADNNGELSGAVYIYQRQEASWNQMVKLLPNLDDGEDFSRFPVLLTGDFAFVGGTTTLQSGAVVGAIYVFERLGDTWRRAKKLVPPDIRIGDAFGSRIASDGNYLIVSSFLNDDQGENAGKAYIFRRNGSDWIEEAILKPEELRPDDTFGISLAINSDFAFVGAHKDDTVGEDHGTVYVFKREGEHWIKMLNLLPDGDIPRQMFYGVSVGLSEGCVVVGAAYDLENGLANTGTLFIFKEEGLGWTQVGTIKARGKDDQQEFGINISTSERFVIVGDRNDRELDRLTGAAYIFDLATFQDGVCEHDDNNLQPSSGLSLIENYPNPFTQSTTFGYVLDTGEIIQVAIYDTLGRRVELLYSGEQSAGYHAIEWHPEEALPSGHYFIQLKTDSGLTSVLPVIKADL